MAFDRVLHHPSAFMQNLTVIILHTRGLLCDGEDGKKTARPQPIVQLYLRKAIYKLDDAYVGALLASLGFTVEHQRNA